jgi:hypothetical protein
VRRISAALIASLIASATATAAAAPSALGAGVLPDLVADPPNRVELTVDATAKERPALLVRFDGFIHNKGPGPMEFRGERDSWNDPMQVAQRVFEPGGVLFQDRSTGAEMEFSDADGHHHWHLQRAARYSLVFGDRARLAAPAEKVGFCLVDSEKVPADGVGPGEEVYTDERSDNCQQLRPDTLNVHQGVSPGWKDIYTKGLAFQWVDVSDVQPGSYWLRVDMDPDRVVDEANEVNVPAFSDHEVVVPGYTAQPLQARTSPGTAIGLTLPADGFQVYEGPTLPAARFTVVDQPDHGTLSAPSGASVTYTPDPGWSGVDTFSYTAADPSSAFPHHPAVATASVTVGEPPPAPTVTISGAPTSVVAGTSVQLQAAVTGDAAGVSWSATAGTIGADGLYAAPAEPPAGGSVTVTASSAAGAKAEVTFAITPKPLSRPKPLPPDPDPDPPTRNRLPKPTRPALSKIGAMRMGRHLTANVRPNVTGRVRITAYARRRSLGTCVARVAGGRTFTCRLKLPTTMRLRERIGFVAGLRTGRTLTRRTRAAAAIPVMVTGGAGVRRVRAGAARAAAPGAASSDTAGGWAGTARSLFCRTTPQ